MKYNSDLSDANIQKSVREIMILETKNEPLSRMI